MTTASERFDGLARNYAISEVHSQSPSLDRLRSLLPRVESVCDVASGAGHSGLSYAGIAQRIVAVDPAPHMLAQVRQLAAERNVAVETIQAFAESIPLPTGTFDLVVCRLAAHHFSDVAAGVREMVGIARPGGYVAVIDLVGEGTPELDNLIHTIEVLHDPTHVRSYTAPQWRQWFDDFGLNIVTCEPRCREVPAGLTIERWCELGGSGTAATQEINRLLAAAPADHLTHLEISRDADGRFRLPVHTILIVGQKPA
ncbi:MAG: class I SAM-dependent methyltransferase [Planctomycetes bacterium]|nr:class I SAM-dependent methyltransferase [Planctomycetota bacterium]